MTVVETPPSDEAGLELPDEPVALRETMRHAVLGGADWEESFGAELGVGDALWRAWGAQLEAGGMDRAAFAAVVNGYRRELWFWLLGDRIWSQVATGLAGRLLRRLPASPTS